MKPRIRCDDLEVFALPGLPVFSPGDDLAAAIVNAAACSQITLRDDDVLAVTSKAVSRCEGRIVPLASVTCSAAALRLADEVGKDARLVELILGESAAVSRCGPNVLITRHRLGFVTANSGVDASNAVLVSGREAHGPWVILLPIDPDASALGLRNALREQLGVDVGVVITDSFGRPFRLGTVGAAIGVSGLPPLWDKRGEVDLFERALEQTITALADQVAAAADLVAGQGAERRAVVVVRGLKFARSEDGAGVLCRDPARDLYA
jgi:coenzyme F420-0:L-glutamate ligase / coenzyme F420-1:gamma-L-glutamate ligase